MSLDKKRAVEKSLFEISKKQPFLAALISQIDIIFDQSQKIACISFDKKKNIFFIRLHPENFTKLTGKEQVAVLLHEIMHFTHGHIFRINFEETAEKRRLQNIAADCAINQFIMDLPEGCIYPKTFGFDNNKTFEVYYNLLLKMPPQEQKNESDGSGKPEFDSMDEHNWDEMTESDKFAMLSEAKKLITRTLEKTSRDSSNVDQVISDLFEYIDLKLQKINYRKILESSIKKTISHANRESTWNKPNKRYGVYSPGSRNGRTPRLAVFVDTSGSISKTELNQFFQTIDGFLKNGYNKCTLGLWHTDLYHVDKYRLNNGLEDIKIQSGGTDITQVMENIDKNNYDLSIVLTDGYYDKVDSFKVKNNNMIWIISDSKYHQMNHPYAKIGKTLSLEGIINE